MTDYYINIKATVRGKLLDVKEGDVIAHIEGYYCKEKAIILEQARKYQAKLINNGAEVIMQNVI